MTMVLLIILSWFFPALTSAEERERLEHAIYVSVVEIEQLQDQNGVMRVKVFYDDLEAAIQNYSGNRIVLNDELSCNQNSIKLEEYFTEHLKLSIQGDPINYQFTSCEKNGDSIWLEFEFNSTVVWRTLRIENDHFMELFPTQTNVFSVTGPSGKRMFKLTKSESVYELSF